MNDFIPPPAPRREPSEASKLFGALLMAVGVLVATLCGLCSLAVGGAMIASSVQQLGRSDQTGAAVSAVVQMLILIGVFGGVPFGIGVALIFAGLRLRGAPKARGSR